MLILRLAAVDSGFQSPKWATYKQWQEMGCQVKKGSKATYILRVLSGVKRDEETGEAIRAYRYLKAYTVFNADQVEGYEGENRVPPSGDLDEFVAKTGATITYGGDRACYVPALDEIRMPPKATFADRASLAGTLFHELGHWTGHTSRLNRDMTGKFRSDAYAMEELVAELTAAFLCGHFGLSAEPREDHVNYIHGWIRVLKSDPTALHAAASKATEATSFLLRDKVVCEEQEAA